MHDYQVECLRTGDVLQSIPMGRLYLFVRALHGKCRGVYLEMKDMHDGYVVHLHRVDVKWPPFKRMSDE